MFRILDLGAHDGFVTNWIAREARLDVEIDGIELNREGIAHFERRMKRDGIPGKCYEGNALQAHIIAEAGAYDAVVAFELIEHIADPSQLLDVCETMVKPGGRIYISTPDGTFGEGNNPHHLHAFRAVELYEMLRRRGTIQDMIVGYDGVTVVAYTPSYSSTRGREVAIYCGPGWQRWSPLDIESKGLGGSETAAVRLAESLDKAGYCVTVYGEVDEICYKQIAFRRHETFDPTVKRRAVILSRAPYALDRNFNADDVLFWAHDTEYGVGAFTPERVGRLDAVMVLSQWHRSHWLTTYPEFFDGKVYVTGNGIEPSYFTRDADAVRNEHRAIYTSSPDRGLDIILSLWPQVRERVPDAEFYFAYADVYNAVADKNPHLQAFRNKVRRLSDQEGVFNLGALPQQGVALAMREAGVWLAPSYNTLHDAKFHETYCIGATEAAAAGCTIIASKWGALTERIEDCYAGVLIDSDDKGKIDTDAWVRAISDAMIGEYDRISSPVALSRTWDAVAQDFIAVIEG